MKFKHQGKEYDMPVRKFKDQKSADKFSKALDKKKVKYHESSEKDREIEAINRTPNRFK